MTGDTSIRQRVPRATMHQRLILLGVLVVGFALRLYQFPVIPAGLNQDEISAGYESWSLLLYGTDRWGYHLPAYFLSWGSGMNVLYSYLSMPFIAMFGLTPLAVRMVALLAGLALLPLLYVTVKRWRGVGQALVATAMVAIMPWGWMTARWGLESNLLPICLLIGIYTLGIALHGGASTWQRLVALLPFAVAMYAYGLGVLTVLSLLVLAGVRYHREIRAHWRSWLGGGALALVLALPFLLFLLKAYVFRSPLPFENLLPFTIPTLTETRLAQVGSAFTGAPAGFSNLVLLVDGFNDGSVWNSLPGYATIPTAIVLIASLTGIIRVVNAIRQRRRPQPDLLDLWLLACVPLYLLIPLNVNQGNALYLPLVILAARGVHAVLGILPKPWYRRLVAMIIAAVIAIPSLLGYAYYVGGAYTANARQSFNPDLGQALARAVPLAGDKPIYITATIPLAYVQTLWYLHIPAKTFQAAHPSVTSSHDFKNFKFDATNPQVHDYYFFGRGFERPNCTRYAITQRLGDYSLGYCA